MAIMKRTIKNNLKAGVVATLLCLPAIFALAQKPSTGASPNFLIVEEQRLAVTRSTGGLLFEAETFGVQIGRGGTAAQRSDTDLIVYDPFEGLTEQAFFFNASLSDLRIGSGFAANPGDDGDIFLEDGSGRTTIELDGGGALLRLGVSGNHGDLQVRDAANHTMFNFTADNALLQLGTTTDDGDLWLRNSGNAVTINMDGHSGNITNALNGNGLVKAWARIAVNGTVLSCFRCNTSAAETRRLGIGFYEVDFTPVATNIRSRPWSATLTTHVVTNTPFLGGIATAHRSGDTSSVLVRTTNSNGVFADRPFTLVIY